MDIDSVYNFFPVRSCHLPNDYDVVYLMETRRFIEPAFELCQYEKFIIRFTEDFIFLSTI